MNVKQLYEYTARFLASQTSYSCKLVKENPWILGAGANSISIWPDKKGRGTNYRIEARIRSNDSNSECEYEIQSLEKYRVFKYARKKRPV